MQIQLKQSHIEAAIRAYVAKAGIQFPVDEINFTAGRGKDGLTATIEMEDPFVDDVPAPVGKTPRKAKPEPAPEPEAIAEPEPEPVPETGEQAPPFDPDEEDDGVAAEADAKADAPVQAAKPKGASLFG